MTPKEKAYELADKFYNHLPLKHEVITTIGDLSWDYDNWKSAKVCALIAVDEIIDESHDYVEHHEYHHNLKYWQEVKKELENL